MYMNNKRKKKEYKPYDYYEFKTKRFWENFIGGLLWLAFFLICYGIYLLYEYFTK